MKNYLRLKYTAFFVLSAFVSFLILNCGIGPKDGDFQNFDRIALLRHLVENQIVPTYQSLLKESQKLYSLSDAFCQSPSASQLQAIQRQWREVRALYKQAEVFAIGPMTTLRIDRELDSWPTRSDLIEALINDKNKTIDDILIDTQGVNAKGFAALEYLFFNPQKSLEEIFQTFNQTQFGERRCEYALALSRHFNRKTSQLLNAWVSSDGFAQTLIQAGTKNSVYTTPQNALNEIVNRMIVLIDTIQMTYLGQPLGSENGGTLQPEKIQASLSKNSFEDIKNNLLGLKMFYLGGSGTGFDDLLRTLDEAFPDYFPQQIDQALSTLESFHLSFQETMVRSPASLDSLLQEIKVIKQLLEGQFSSLLGISIEFGQNDGD